MSLLRNVDPQALFGNEAGEEESPDFLKEVYIESSIYKRALGSDRVLCVRLIFDSDHGVTTRKPA
jgi:hypothetical protein